MAYNFKSIEQKWQKKWQEEGVYKVEIDPNRPKYYVLDMFPYPSGAGLHVGHPLGYIASDIYSRYKRLKGFNVLHPMGYDAFGLPAEQYAIQTGQHPAKTTQINAKRYREQLDKIGFSYDWSREFKTSDPDYYKWTQWVFVQLFNHYFNTSTQKAEPITDLVRHFEANGTQNIAASGSEDLNFTAEEWKSYSEEQQQKILLNYRLAYLSETNVNWCAELGTVLANDEITNGVSVRGGHPVEQKKMLQWSLRVSAYAERLLNDLEDLEWTDALKEIQRNWIGRSEGAEIDFKIKNSEESIKVFTTRSDTVFGVTFMVLAPESDLVETLTTAEQKAEVEAYIKETKKRSERDRISDTKTVSGVFSGAYAQHPVTGEDIPIWVADYVLSGYGTGAIMAVPAHDTRDFAFAKKFDLPIRQVVIKKGDAESDAQTWEDAYDSKEGININSDFLNGLSVKESTQKMLQFLEEKGIGTKQINYRLRDAIFSRQRYWGEPFPVYFKNDFPYTLSLENLPLELPEVDQFLPTSDGRPPLGRAKNWKTEEGFPFELSTMPGFAGSSAYYLRYMDSKNTEALVSKEANDYWQDVDLYIGGTEHATGHLIYSRFWNKFLFDIGWICKNEPFKKLINQGMIQGRSNFVYRIKNTNTFVSETLIKDYETDPIHVDVNLVKNDILDIEAFKQWRPEFADAEFILDEGVYHCGYAVEKMSKSLYNVVNPDDIIEQYGADTLRLYEMFLGPLEQAKPWDTNGIDGVFKFFRKVWNLFYNNEDQLIVEDKEPSKKELKILHKTIKKIQFDIEHFSFNTSVSAFMIFINEMGQLKSHNKSVLESFLIILSPFAPHICEELWYAIGHQDSIIKASFPEFQESYLVENEHEYPVSFNGKMRFKMKLPSDITDAKVVEQMVKDSEMSAKWLEGKEVKKLIFVPKKIINVVVK